MSVSRLSKQSVQAGFPKQQTVWDQTTGAVAMDCLGSITLAGTSSSIVFQSIPATYTHLQLRTYGLSSNTDAYMYFNTDTTNTNYRRAGFMGDGGSGTVFNDNAPYTDAGNVQSYAQLLIYDILDYTNPNKNKMAKILFGQDNNGSGRVGLESITWYGGGTSAVINKITLSGRSYTAGTNVSLYGIR
jgi:hypothetical protein